MEKKAILRLGLPKGSLQESTFALMAKAGWKVSSSSRSYQPRVDDAELDLRLIRAQEISRYVEHGFLDAGLTGADWIKENASDVQVVCEVAYSKQTTNPARWVLAVPNDSSIKSVKDLQGKRIATELVGHTRRWLEEHGVQAEVEFSWGATEVKAPELVDAIVDITETGSSLKANNLRIVDTLCTSFPQLIANKSAWQDAWKRKKIETLALLLRAALAAEEKVGLKMNVPRAKLDGILKALPALRNPTVAPLTQEGWVAIETIIDEKIVREIIPQLKTMGAEGIIEYPLNKVIY
jgi:ATP phosphoribosyltransferase